MNRGGPQTVTLSDENFKLSCKGPDSYWTGIVRGGLDIT
jgi:hypothetical protein